MSDNKQELSWWTICIIKNRKSIKLQNQDNKAKESQVHICVKWKGQPVAYHAMP